MAGDERWYFTKEQLANTPSRKNGIDADKELSYRQQAANLIQDMGQRLQVTQLCINTAIVYMHRFFMFHSMTYFHRNQMALAALFLAAKVEEQPRKLEHLIKIGHLCLHRTDVKIDINSESYLEQAQDIVCHENILLQTLGFDVAIDHPHTHVVRCCQLVKACKDLAQTSYFMASNSLHLTMMCLQYKPTVVACFCIHLACKWACWEIPQSNEGRPWYYYVDPTVTFEDLEAMTAEFLHVFDRCPSRLRKRIMSMTKNSESPSRPLTNSPFDCEPKKIQPDPMLAGSSGHNSLPALAAASREKEEKQKAAFGSSSLTGRSNEVRDYREKKERERMEREKSAGISFSHHSSSHSSHSMHKPGMPTQNKHQSSNPKNALYGHPHVKPDMVKSSQGVPQRQHNSSSSTVSRDPNQRQKPRDYHMPVTQNQSHGLPSLENSVSSHSVNSVENNKHQSMHDKRHGEHRYKQPGQQMEHRKDRKVMEDVRKTIEKNAPQKPREEQMKEDYMSHMLKQTHKPNYMQDKGPPPPPMTHSAHGVAKILKDNIKNGNSSSGGSATSFSLNSVFEDNNRLPVGRPEETLKSPPPSQPARQRSLFSPESTPVKAEIQQRTVKYNKQKTPPKVVAKVPKRENTSFELPHLESSFTNHQQQEKRVPSSEQSATVHKKMDMGMNIESVDTKSSLENFIKMEQPYRNDSLSNMMNGMLVKSESTDDDSLKSSLSDLSKFNSSINFETESLHMFKPPEIKQEPDVVDMIKKEDEPPSPMKSAKSINALLQEAIQTPSTLTSKSSLASVTTPVSEVPSPATIPTTVDLRAFSIPLVPVQTTCVTTLASHISSSTQLTNSTMLIPTASEVASAPNVDPSLNMFDLLSPQSDDKKEHHKSEKKKKEKKHKHKDKDKDKGKKEKHKHRHKEKDKESRKNRDKEKDKEREKERDKDVPLTAAPIKITIPKDKITLSADMDKSSSGLKIKIPKERIKPPEGTNSSGAAPLSSPPGAAVTPVQAPLKIKIRTSANSSEIAPAHELQAPPSRKRDRERSEVEPSAMSAAKRPATVQPVGGVAAYATQRPSERQNGRHYGSSSNNKVRGRGIARGGPFPAQPRQTGYPNFRPDSAASSSFFYANYPPPPPHALYHNPTPGYMYDPSMFYQPFPQQYMYPPNRNVIVTADGAIDTSVPPPMIVNRSGSCIPSQFPGSASQSNTPPPPPLPQDPPPANPPLPMEDGA